MAIYSYVHMPFMVTITGWKANNRILLHLPYIRSIDYLTILNTSPTGD